jgi:hypothetical protein
VVLATGIWLASTVMLLSAEWTLSCTVQGQPLGGSDCLQANAAAETDSAPASSIGFLPLVACCLLSATVLAVLAAFAFRARRRGRGLEPPAS